MKLLVLDNVDSFTYMLVDYLQQAGADCRVLRNTEPLSNLTNLAVDGVVLSPGPGTPRQAGRLMAVVDYYHWRLPMLGVCLGHQALGEFFGASLKPAHQPMHGKVSTVYQQTDDGLFCNIPESFGVTRYHSLVITDLPSNLIHLAATDRGELMAMRHRTWPLWGVQFHPEAVLTQFGLQVVKNWVALIGSTPTQSISATSATSLTHQYA